VNAFYFRRRSIHAININLSSHKNYSDAVKQTDLVFCVNGYGELLFHVLILKVAVVDGEWSMVNHCGISQLLITHHSSLIFNS
jgi:hypothetical protein